MPKFSEDAADVLKAQWECARVVNPNPIAMQYQKAFHPTVLIDLMEIVNATRTQALEEQKQRKR